jgi:hypothetical protein
VPPDTAVLVTARNEAECIGQTLAALRAAFPGARVVVADDASRDATPDIARAEGAEVVRSPLALGKGGAATLGARAVLGEGAELVVLCDGDLGASARHLPRLAEAVANGDGDLAVAAFARPVGGGFGLALAGARRAIEVATGERPRAPLSGQRAMRRELLGQLVPFALGFGMETAMTIDALRAGHRLVEVELPLEHRATGRTPAGFLHRARQLRDIRAAARSRSARP